jgi:hypothetical protein
MGGSRGTLARSRAQYTIVPRHDGMLWQHAAASPWRTDTARSDHVALAAATTRAAKPVLLSRTAVTMAVLPHRLIFPWTGCRGPLRARRDTGCVRHERDGVWTIPPEGRCDRALARPPPTAVFCQAPVAPATV